MVNIMYLTYKKTHKYLCSNCDTQFNWEQGKTFRYGKYEYKTKQERVRTDKYYCSKKCANINN